MKKSLLALASGTLGLGIAEFVMMGILPNVADDLIIVSYKHLRAHDTGRDIVCRLLLEKPNVTLEVAHVAD